MLPVLAFIIVLAVIGLGFYGLKGRTGWLRIQAGIWRLVTFSIEIDRSGEPGEPGHEPRDYRDPTRSHTGVVAPNDREVF